jgi:phosphoglycolate phosphatase
MAPEKLKGIVFDLDGTLIQSKIDFPKMKRNMIGILESNGISEGVLTPTDTTVVTLEKAERMWDESGKPEEERIPVRAELNDAMNRGELEAIPLVREIEGASETIRKLKEKGYKMVILTRSHNSYAVEALRKIGALRHFDLILGRGETKKPKPYAEALRHTAELIGLELDELVFVGDHHIDAQSAVNAGCTFIGVDTGRRGRDSWQGEQPETLLGSIKDLPEYLDDI